jgi:hypothetical protein
MAKKEYWLTGDFSALLCAIDRGILEESESASFEDGSDWSCNDVCCAVRVYERFSIIGGNRVSLSITVVGRGRELFVAAITSGGSQAVFLKINTLGERAFLDSLDAVIRDFETREAAE